MDARDELACDRALFIFEFREVFFKVVGLGVVRGDKLR